MSAYSRTISISPEGGGLRFLGQRTIETSCLYTSKWPSRALIGIIFIVSAWTPFTHPAIASRWFTAWNFVFFAPVPLLVIAATWLQARFLQKRDAGAMPFVLSLLMIFLGYSGLAISMWPNIIPPSRKALDEFEIGRGTYNFRIKAGMSVEDALSATLGTTSKKEFTLEGETWPSRNQACNELAARYGITPDKVKDRLVREFPRRVGRKWTAKLRSSQVNHPAKALIRTGTPLNDGVPDSLLKCFRGITTFSSG